MKDDTLSTILISLGVLLLLVSAYVSISEFYNARIEAKNFAEAATEAMKYLVKAIPLIMSIVVGAILLDYGVKARSVRVDVQD